MKVRLSIIIALLCTLNGVAQEKALSSTVSGITGLSSHSLVHRIPPVKERASEAIIPVRSAIRRKVFLSRSRCRLQVGASKAKGSMVADDMYSWAYMYTTVDILFNLNNIFAPYKENRHLIL